MFCLSPARSFRSALGLLVCLFLVRSGLLSVLVFVLFFVRLLVRVCRLYFGNKDMPEGDSTSQSAHCANLMPYVGIW